MNDTTKKTAGYSVTANGKTVKAGVGLKAAQKTATTYRAMGYAATVKFTPEPVNVTPENKAKLAAILAAAF